MGRWLSLIAALTLLPQAGRAEDNTYTVAYYYKVRWGFQQEFERLFFKNHYPLLMAQKERMKDVQCYRPKFHGDGRGDWTFLVVITYADWAALGASTDEDALARRLFPDFETYKKEEQRRFEILEAHWDVPLTPVGPPK